MMKSFKNTLWLLVSVFVIALDQLTKHWAKLALKLGKPVAMTGFLNLNLSFNSGAAFGFLDRIPAAHGLLVALPVIVVIILIVWLARLGLNERWRALALALIIGGALGNFIDRAFIGIVTDFIDFHIGNWHYATFNVADSAVCAGAGILIVQLLFNKANKKID